MVNNLTEISRNAQQKLFLNIQNDHFEKVQKNLSCV